MKRAKNDFNILTVHASNRVISLWRALANHYHWSSMVKFKRSYALGSRVRVHRTGLWLARRIIGKSFVHSSPLEFVLHCIQIGWNCAPKQHPSNNISPCGKDTYPASLYLPLATDVILRNDLLGTVQSKRDHTVDWLSVVQLLQSNSWQKGHALHTSPL